MSFSIRDFFHEASRALSPYVDFRSACAGSIAALNEDPTSRMAETDIYSRLSSEGVPHDMIHGLRMAWEPQFKRYRDLSSTNPRRTPPLKLFKICAQSAAARHNHALDRVLAKEWLALATSPEEEDGLDALIARMKTLRIAEEWRERLVSTWKFLFEAGGHGDRNIMPPSVYYEVFDRERSHVEIRTPHDEDLDVHGIRKYREQELSEALSLIDQNRLVLVLGHPGWRPVARSFDLWLETLEMKLSGQNVTIIKPETIEAALPAIAKAESGKFVILAETGHSPHAAAAEKIAKQLADAGVKGSLPVLAIDHKALNHRQVAQIIFGEKALQNGHEAQIREFTEGISSAWPMLPADISYLADALEDMASKPDMKTLGKRIQIDGREKAKNRRNHELDEPQAVSMPNGDWGRYMERMLALSRTNVVTIGPCTAPFFTMNLGLKA